MIDDPSLAVAGLAERLAIDASVVRAALAELADLALIRLDPATESARIVRPTVALTALLNRIERDVAIRQRQIEATRETIAAIAAVHGSNDQLEETRRIDGLDAVRDRLSELALQVDSECLSFTTGGAQASDTISAEKSPNQLALERGVVMRNVYQESFRNDPATLAHARWMASLGGQSRTVPTLPMRMVIVDRRIALVPIDPTSPGDGALEVHGPGLVAGLIALFERVWESGTWFGDRPSADSNGLQPLERAVLRLLATGHTDESAARSLAISVRSFQRITAAITERLGSASRFQAGVEASRRGWI